MAEEGSVRRGEVYLLDLSAFGGRLTKTRPVVVVQNDAGNRHSSETIVAATRDPHGGRMLPVFVALRAGTGGIDKDCVIDAGHLQTVAQPALGRRLGVMPPAIMEQLNRALARSLGIR